MIPLKKSIFFTFVKITKFGVILGPHDEVPRRRDPLVEIVHDGIDFVELITDDPEDDAPAPPRPR